MQGTLTVESVSGLGSTFRFSARFDLQSDDSEAESKAGPWKVLLCEDSPDNAYLVKAYLEGAPYEIEHVTDGAAGVDRFKSGIFDLVLMDLQMPVLDGYAATRQIRQWEAGESRSPTPILALTANAQKAHSERCAACGCTEILSKPIRKVGLLGALARHVAGSKGINNSGDFLSAARKFVPGYLKHKRLDIDRLSTAIESADYDTISTVGHQLKGSGPSYGFEEFFEIGSALERAGSSHNLDETRSQAALLAAFLSRASIANPKIS
jgi:CheY-like chemotaxis protein